MIFWTQNIVAFPRCPWSMGHRRRMLCVGMSAVLCKASQCGLFPRHAQVSYTFPTARTGTSLSILCSSTSTRGRWKTSRARDCWTSEQVLLLLQLGLCTDSPLPSLAGVGVIRTPLDPHVTLSDDPLRVRAHTLDGYMDGWWMLGRPLIVL